MTKKTKQQIFRYVVYFLVLVVLFSLQTAPRLFEIQGIKPVIIIPYVLAIAMFENEIVSGIFCGLGGMFWDLSSNCVFGFNTIIFFVVGVAISLVIMHLLRNKVLNYIIFLSIALVMQGLLYYGFYYVLWETVDAHIILLRYILPTIVYTIVTGIPIFYFVGFLTKKLKLEIRM